MDTPIHLRKYTNIFKEQEHTEDSVSVPVWLRQGSLDALYATIQILAGMEKTGQGGFGVTHELVMLYRTIEGSIKEENERAGKEAE